MNDKTYVWDLLVRIFHWTLVLAFIIAYLTGDEENALHVYSGYYILGLVLIRILWGLVGTRYARFRSFTFSPRSVQAYLKNLFSTGSGKKYTGHNPAGSWMVIIMLTSLLATGFSGLKVYGLEGYGPLAQTVKIDNLKTDQHNTGLINVSDSKKEHNKEKDKNGGDEFWEEIHEFLANFTVLLVLLHISGVILSSKKHGQNLIRAMITGYKQ